MRASEKKGIIKEMVDGLKKILIVDDESYMRDAGGRVLRRRLRANIMTADNGGDAINTARSIVYDLILLDLNIPVRNGWEVIDEIRKFDTKTKILVVSGLDKNYFTPEQVNKIDALTSGFIHKPFIVNNIVQKIAEILGEDVSIDPISLEPDTFKGRPEAREIVHDLNELHGTMRISCEEYFYSKEYGYFNGKPQDEIITQLETVLNDVLDGLSLAHKVVERIRKL
jgi:DNA-binding response OmpR family regulator